jgi:hypothetical protein
MKPQKTQKKDDGKSPRPDFDSVLKILKKKELQTEILKKIIKENNPSDNQ